MMLRWAQIIPMVLAVHACVAGEPPVVDLDIDDIYLDFENHQSVALPEAGPVAFGLISDNDLFVPDNLSIGPAGGYSPTSLAAAQAYDPLTQRHWMNDGNAYILIGQSGPSPNPIAHVTAMGAYSDLLFFANEARQFAVVDATTGQQRVIDDAFPFQVPIGGMCAETGVDGEMVLLICSFTLMHAFKFDGDPLNDGSLVELARYLPDSTDSKDWLTGVDWSEDRLFIRLTKGITRYDNFPLHFCDPDLTMDGELNFLDVSAFLTSYNAMDPNADFTDDGVFNFLDVSAFLSAFQTGCP